MPDQVFHPGESVQQGDLCVHFQDADGLPTNVAVITYAVYYVDPGPPETEVLIGGASKAARIPVNPNVGEYYASLMIPPTALVGRYRIRWTYQEAAGTTVGTIVEEFQVQPKGLSVVSYSAAVQECIRVLRIHLRDQNPDKFYRFMPPEHEGRIGKFNRVFGQIWEDEELYTYLDSALAEWNMAPPSTGYCTIDELVASQPAWKAALLWGAIKWAALALTFNWIANEFDYSIGGISLSLEKSSKYEGLKQNAESQMDKLFEQKTRTVKIIRGVAQPRFGVGVRSSFGPHVGRGVLSPRSFVG